jgi:hypothetical protein
MSGFFINGVDVNTLFKTPSTEFPVQSNPTGFTSNGTDLSTYFAGIFGGASRNATNYKSKDKDFNSIFEDSRRVLKRTSITSTTTWTAPTDVNKIDIALVGGGGGGGYDGGGGGGGGGVIITYNYAVTPGQAYSVTIGGAGSAATGTGNIGGNGGNTIFNTLTAYGGGGGSSNHNAAAAGDGGSGGGRGAPDGPNSLRAGYGTQGQGYDGGGSSSNGAGGGGGGAGGTGNSGSTTGGGDGGIGVEIPASFTIYPYPASYGNGGGGGSWAFGYGGQQYYKDVLTGQPGWSLSGGNNQANGVSNTGRFGIAYGTGGGGSGNAGGSPPAGRGASGVVLIKYYSI